MTYMTIHNIYIIEFCIIPQFGNPLTHAGRRMYYLPDIINLG